MRKHKNYWNRENCATEALKYKSKVEFIRNSMSAYNSAIKNGWLEEICVHMIRPEQHNKYWTKEKCLGIALKYKSRIEFQKSNNCAYAIASKYGWLRDITKHMVRPKNVKKFWFEENCRTEALKYNTRKDFNEYSKGAYLAAIKYDIIDDICSHMEVCGTLTKRCVYVYEFSDNHAYVGLTYNLKSRHSQHMRMTKSSVNKHMKNTGLIPNHHMLTDGYVDVYLAKDLEKKFYNDYMSAGWQMLNSNRTGGTGWCKLPAK